MLIRLDVYKRQLAKVIANTTRANFTQINATVAGKKDMEQVVKEAQEQLGMYGKKTILFIDEIHRFNKGQQDYLLPFVEDGTIILICLLYTSSFAGNTKESICISGFTDRICGTA